MNAAVQPLTPQAAHDRPVPDRPGYIAEALVAIIETGIPVKEIRLAAGEPLQYLSPSGWGPFQKERVVAEDDLNQLMRFAADKRYDAVRRINARSQYDEALTCGNVRLRCNFYRERGRLAASVRCLPLVPWSYDTLGAPMQLQQIVDRYTSGLVLVTGPMGSGKSSTLAGLLSHINATRSCHILTLEDPIEYLLQSDKAMISQRQVGDIVDGGDVPTFTAGLLGAKRQHADVILVGELRDPETVKTAFQAAEAGSLVFASTHSDNAPGAIEALLSYFRPEELEVACNTLASTLRAVLSQKILPSVDKKSWVLAYEYLPRNPSLVTNLRDRKVSEIRRLIREPRTADGTTSLNSNLKSLVEQGQVEPEVALAAAYDKKDLSAALGLSDAEAY